MSRNGESKCFPSRPATPKQKNLSCYMVGIYSKTKVTGRPEKKDEQGALLTSRAAEWTMSAMDSIRLHICPAKFVSSTSDPAPLR